MDDVGKQLRALRARTPHTVRSVARFLGFENHSRYSYYESPRAKAPLPIDMARRLAELFYRSGKVEPREVMALAGLSEGEAQAEEQHLLVARRGGAEPQFLKMAVQLPSEEALTEMFGGMLEVAGRPDLAAELAGQLARLLPTALSVTPVAVPAPDQGRTERVPVARLLRAAKDDLDWL